MTAATATKSGVNTKCFAAHNEELDDDERSSDAVKLNSLCRVSCAIEGKFAVGPRGEIIEYTASEYSASPETDQQSNVNMRGYERDRTRERTREQVKGRTMEYACAFGRAREM